MPHAVMLAFTGPTSDETEAEYNDWYSNKHIHDLVKLSGVIVTVKSTSTISTAAKASTMVGTINLSIQNVNGALAKMASGVKKFTIQATFVSKLVDTLNAGIGNLVDADMAVESAKLQSLQVKQQLGIQALSIANAAPSITLSLFR